MKHLSILCGLALLVVASVFYGVGDQIRQGFASQAYHRIFEDIRLAAREAQGSLDEPVWMLHPARHPGSGVTQGADMDDGALILLTGYLPGEGGAQHLRLIRRDGSTVAGWNLHEMQLPPSSRETQREIYRRPRAALLAPDGSPTIALGRRGMIRVTRCGEVSFYVDKIIHHDLTRAEGGGYWTLGQRDLDRATAPADLLPPFTSARFHGLAPDQLEALEASPTIRDDTVVWLGEGGEVLLEFSITRMLYDNGLRHLLAMFHNEGHPNLLNANSVHELTADLAPAFPMFAQGDLLLSLRKLSMLVVADPRTRKVKWQQVGPWIRQHDARFQPDGTITLFNNKYGWRDDPHLPPLDSNILRLDPADGSVQVVAGLEVSEESRFYTRTRGQHQMLPGGDILAVPSEQGRVLQLSPQGRIVWAYLNRYDEDRVGVVRNAWVYPAGYFQVDDWSCPP